jgi:hypothetical protein
VPESSDPPAEPPRPPVDGSEGGPGDVRSAEERVRALLDAVLAIGGDLDMRATLQRVVDSAARLVDARYAALGVLDRTSEGLSLFFTHGISEE